MQDLRVTLIQTDLEWENAAHNLNRLSQKIERIKEETDLIVLPEMFTTAFTMNAENVAEMNGGHTIEWMQNKAHQKSADLIGSIIIKENGHYYNRLFHVTPHGSIQHYDKRHLFRMAGEHNVFNAGEQKLHIRVKGWKILPLICYDLRFPVWARKTDAQPYDALIYIANWPERRSSHWRLLLKARAVENQAYTIGVNRVGTDGLGIKYSGDSACITPLGETLYQVSEKEDIQTVTLSWQEMERYRNKFPVWQDADRFKIE